MTEYLVQGTLYSTSAFRNTLGPKEEYSIKKKTTKCMKNKFGQNDLLRLS